MKQMWGKLGVNYDDNEGDETLGKITDSMFCSWKFIVQRMLMRKTVYGMT